MTVEELSHLLGLQMAAGKKGSYKEVKGVYIGDLLSLVMAHAKEGDLWITVQGHINSVAVAVLDNLPAILLIEGIQPDDMMRKKAEEEGIVILTTRKSSYEMAKELIKVLL